MTSTPPWRRLPGLSHRSAPAPPHTQWQPPSGTPEQTHERPGPEDLQQQLPGHCDTDGWRRLHKITPLLKGWQLVVAFTILAVQQSFDTLAHLTDAVSRRGGTGAVLLVASAAVLLFLTVVTGWAVLSWRATRYRVTEQALQMHSGLLFRQQRQVRLDRLQAVDVVQPLLGRVFGLAELKMEVAGGPGSGVALAYLTLGDADTLRNVLLAHAAGVSFEGEQAPAAPERPLVELPTPRIVGSLVRSAFSVWLVCGLILLVILVILGGWPFLFVPLPVLIPLGGYGWARFNRSFGFRVAASPDGLRLRRGLLETRAQTVPPGRLQAVKLTQPLLWRGKDWWRLTVNVAGYAGEPGDDDSGLLMPVATRDEALILLAQVLPDLGHPRPREIIDEGLTGVSDGGADRSGLGFLCAPPVSRWLDPLSWRRHGVAVSERALIIRSGRLTRSLVLVPHERTQSLAITRGPLQRAMKLAEFQVHSTGGAVVPRVKHLAEGQAGALLAEQARRARLARAGSGPERWMQRAPVTLVKQPHVHGSPQPTASSQTPPPSPAPPQPGGGNAS